MLTDYDPLTGITRKFEYDHVTDGIRISSFQDCTSLIEHNERQVIEADHTQQIKNDWIKYASVPYVVIEKWKREYGVNFFSPDPAEFKKVMMMINSRDWRKTKTTTLTHDR